VIDINAQLPIVCSAQEVCRFREAYFGRESDTLESCMGSPRRHKMVKGGLGGKLEPPFVRTFNKP